MLQKCGALFHNWRDFTEEYNNCFKEITNTMSLVDYPACSVGN